jgi:hypothetical protein
MLLYIFSFLALSAVPFVLGAYGGHLAAEVVDNPRHRRNAMLIVWGLAAIGVVLAGCQQCLVYESDKDHEATQGKLSRQLEASSGQQQFMRGQLDSIGLMIGKFGERNNNPDMKEFAAIIAKMGQSVRGPAVRVVSVTAPKPNDFRVAHGLGRMPDVAIVQMTSPGIIWWKSPDHMYDANDLYLAASDSGLTAKVYVW